MYCLNAWQLVSTNAAQVTSDVEKNFTELLDDSDSNSTNIEKQVYEIISTVSDIHPCLVCDLAEEMIAPPQPQYGTLQEISDWELESTYNANMKSTGGVSPEPVTWNPQITLTMYDLTNDLRNYSPARNRLSYPHSDMQSELYNTELMLYSILLGQQDLQAHIILSTITIQIRSTQSYELEELYLLNLALLLAYLRHQMEINHMRQDSYGSAFPETL